MKLHTARNIKNPLVTNQMSDTINYLKKMLTWDRNVKFLYVKITQTKISSLLKINMIHKFLLITQHN